jgi:hypothetical protein
MILPKAFVCPRARLLPVGVKRQLESVLLLRLNW